MTNEGSSPCRVPDPAPELIAVLEGLIPGTALDLAAGSGRHAEWLAARGWEVTAVDIALPAEPVGEITWVQADLKRVWVPFRGDLVVCWLYWQADLLPSIASAVKPGGIAALAGKSSGRFATSLAAYRNAFTNWEELSAGEDGVKVWFIARHPL